MTRVLVVGAGLSGLATAWYLSEAGVPVHIVEARSGPGGLISTRREPEGLVETAANAFVRSERVDALFSALGVTPVHPRPSSRRRYVFRGGRPRRWPLTARETAGAAFQLGGAWLTQQVSPRSEETVAAWGRRVFGSHATDWLIAPAMQGIYAAPADVLSARAVLGHRRQGAMKLMAPAAGMGQLIDRLVEGLDRRGVTFEWNRPVCVLDPGRPTAIAVAAPTAAVLVAAHAPRLAAALTRIQMVSLVTVTAFFEPHRGDFRGFGVLFPPTEGVQALGVLANSDVFTGRSAMRSETWIYERSVASEDEIADALGRDRSKLTGRRAPPVALYTTIRPDALPLYDSAVLVAAEALPELPPWLGLSGNYLGRLGVSKLLDASSETAARLARHVRV